MVYLDRLYTRSGDAGETGLGDGTRIRKTHARIVALGAIDELNATLGLALAGDLAAPVREALTGLQNELFDLGADISVPFDDRNPPRLRITPDRVIELERRIDAATARLEPLTSFVMPGGSVGAAALHLARTVCRRAEVDILRLAEAETVNAQAAIYLNRLSDLLFALARLANGGGKNDVLWQPGGERTV
ncbi:MAG: cob(I)yrinic acid a,c-diamide adenosyltransferase [Planctomycetota bacterium]|nr:cob(I)yrinic acid a,c-diamide adenosyltransferase [Planctomycetaceae bacterium]MDQ3329365.1 cob(I)yrinic acid a,c-diamide adenosyltransferase [Planctomycetota bacterium]